MFYAPPGPSGAHGQGNYNAPYDPEAGFYQNNYNQHDRENMSPVNIGANGMAEMSQG